MQSTTRLRAFHQAAWNEPLLHEQTSPGERGLDVPATRAGRARRSRRCPRGDSAGAAPRDPAGATRAVAACRPAPLPATLAGDVRSGHRHPPRPRHLHDEVQPQGERSSCPLAQGHAHAPVAGRRDRAGILESIYRLERIICEISGHGPGVVPARRWIAGGLRERPDDRRLPGGARDRVDGTRSSRRSSPTPATAPDRRPRASSSSRSTRARTACHRRGTRGCALRAHRRPDDHEPRRHGHLQPADRSRWSSWYTRPAASATTTRRTRTAFWGSHGPVTRASTSASSTCTRRSRRRTARWECRAARLGVSAELAPYLPEANRRVRRRALPTGRRSTALDRQGPGIPRGTGHRRALVRLGARTRAPGCGRSRRSLC